jgi:hypothetical protein
LRNGKKRLQRESEINQARKTLYENSLLGSNPDMSVLLMAVQINLHSKEVRASGIRSNYAALKGVQAPPTREEDCLCGMEEERRNHVASTDAQINLKLEVCASGTGQRGSSNYAVLEDVQTKLPKEECA